MVDFSRFQKARLIPVTGIKGDQDQERRATSALLAVLTAVPAFAETLLRPFGAPKGHVEAFIEPEFKVNNQKIRPDGLIAVSWGKRRWVALVEVKTGKNCLDPNVSLVMSRACLGAQWQRGVIDQHSVRALVTPPARWFRCSSGTCRCRIGGDLARPRNHRFPPSIDPSRP